jgi:hypothetical protein
MEKPHTTYIVDDQTAGLFRVNRRAFTDPECLEEARAPFWQVLDLRWARIGSSARRRLYFAISCRPVHDNGAQRRQHNSSASEHLHAPRRSGMPAEIRQREDVPMSLSRMDV